MYTYIIIDDEELIRKGTLKKISPISDQVACIGEAEEGASGIRLISELHPNFVILDMQMPGIDGMELLPYLAEHYPHMPLIVISGYKNFDYIKQAISSNAIEYLLKPFSREAIQEVIFKAVERLHDRSQIHDKIAASEKEKEQACYDYDIQLLNNLILGYPVGDLKMTSQKLSYINAPHKYLLLTIYFTEAVPEAAMQDWLFEHDFGNTVLYMASSVNQHLAFVLIFMPDSSTISNEQIAGSILYTLLPLLEERLLSVRIGISGSHNSLEQLGTAYEETTHALNQQQLDVHAPSCYYYAEDTNSHPIDWKKEDEFLFRIEAGMESDVESLVHEFFSWCPEITDCTLADVKYYCYVLTEQCRKILNAYISITDTVKSSGSMLNVVSHIFTIRELEDYYLRFFLNLTTLLKPNSVYSIDDVIEKIKIYIQRNYQKNLTQEFISSLFYINRSYLSTLFKARTGQKFVDYLNDVRISKSQELLTQSDKKMYQVARSVGYDNVKYFFRIFKKKTGESPERWRLKYGGK